MSFNKLNYQRFWGNTEYFKIKFGREPKNWTIEMIHDLYLRALERHNSRQKLVIDCIDRIVNEVKEFEKDKRTIYFNKNGKIYYRELSRYSQYDSWGIRSADVLKFQNSKLEDRNSKIEFLLSNEKAFELGELYESLQGNTKFIHLRVREILSECIQEALRKKFEGIVAPQILTISIGDKSYYVECSDQHRMNRIYKEFKLLNEVTEEIKL